METELEWHVAFRYTDVDKPRLFQILPDVFTTKEEARKVSKTLLCRRPFESAVVAMEVSNEE